MIEKEIGSLVFVCYNLSCPCDYFSASECDVQVPGIPGTGNFSFFGGIGTGIGTNSYRKQSQNRYRKNLVPKNSAGIGIENIRYRKKVSVSVSFKILGTVTL